MAFQKGRKKTGGRTPGTQNKVTKDAKELMGEIVLYGLQNGQRWLERTAKKNPARALEALNKLAEFSLPKLAKTDIDVHGGVQVLERRIYTSAPAVPLLNSPPKNEDAVDAEVVTSPKTGEELI